MEKEYKVKIILSSDNKHTVMVGEDSLNKEDLENAYRAASTIYKQILKEFPFGTKAYEALEAREAKEALGNCPHCGAKMALSKNGKPYCTAKCWLKNG